jgi:hypothetical protein
MPILWLRGGPGLGAGLMSLLDPEPGVARQDRVRRYVDDSRRHTGVLLDDTWRTLGRQAVLATRRVPCRRQPGRGERLSTQAEALGLARGLRLLAWHAPTRHRHEDARRAYAA